MRKPVSGPLILLALLVIPGGCLSPSFKLPEKSPMVRVQILAAQQKVTLAGTDPATVKSAGESDSHGLYFGEGAVVTYAASGWRIGNASLPAGELTIESAKPAAVRVNGAGYRGRYRLVPVGADKFDVVNDLDVDSYLMGVLPKELLKDWHIESYKAQAIAARTYALYELRTSPTGKHYDLFDDDRSQVYGGFDSETDKSRRAVADTGGVVVAHGPPGREKIFKAYFSSCCGGIGQNAYDAFGDPNIPPLRERSVGGLCSAATRFNWGPVVLTKVELTRRIRIWGTRRNVPVKDLGLLRTIEIAAVNQYQRPVRFFLTDSRGLRYNLSGEELRWACNADGTPETRLLSSLFKPVVTDDAIQFVDAHGWGHGVGMCQWCAQALALRGKPHEEIVRFSYPDAVLVRAY